MKRRYLFLLCAGYAAIFILSGCVSHPRVAIKRGYDISKIKTIGLGRFTNFANYENSGDVARDEFARQLILMGFIVKQSEEGVDAVLEGGISQFAPSKKYLFYAGEKQPGVTTQVVVSAPAIEISGSNVYYLGRAFGLRDESQILVSNATVGISARLIDTATNEIIWTNSFTYEGLDVQMAVENVVNFLVRSITGKGR
ncbi:MAG: hypothetical protein KJ967_01260 [Elusimicrobia bacterium]|nr:hypothetical protein [Elusimicrobiota bacterium]